MKKLFQQGEETNALSLPFLHIMEYHRIYENKHTTLPDGRLYNERKGRLFRNVV